MRAGEASSTARRVAAQRLHFPRLDYPGGRPEDDQLLQADVAGGLEVPETAITRYLRARTAFVDRAVVAALARGVRQLVAVGAGYDGRSLRFAGADVRWFELDHPATQADKLARLDDLGIDRAAIAFAAADFVADDVGAALAAAGHDSTAATMFVCEGVAGYLPAGVVTGLLRTLAGRAAAGSQLAISVSITPDTAAEQAQKEQLATAVAALGEPLASTVDRPALTTYFASAGWDVVSATDPAGVPVADSPRTSALVLARPLDPARP
jgi:methyltransferase (TIGR00027 family)